VPELGIEIDVTQCGGSFIFHDPLFTLIYGASQS
jgi:hypothetical protein